MENNFKSTNNLPFESTPEPTHLDFFGFRIGTCHGLWRANKNSYEILAVINNERNNGHFNDVLEWFEMSSKRDKYELRVLELYNDRLMQHLIVKKGFEKVDENNVVKKFGS